MRRMLATSATQSTLASSAAGSLDVLLERAVRQEDDRAGIAGARLAVLDLVDEGDRDVVLGKDVDRLGQGTHAVGDLQAHIVLSLELVHGLKGEVVTIGLNLGQRSHAAADLLGERQDIAHDGARGGKEPAPAP